MALTNDLSCKTEFIFLGTGASSGIPNVGCLTAPPDAMPCLTCLSTLLPSGQRNVRRNTSAAIRLTSRTDGRPVTIIIDTGKNFPAAALQWFPKYNLRRIDAVLITHAHADAMNGLDDLRAWTLCGAIQPHVDIYLTKDTFLEVRRAFPYLVSRELSNGSGSVPELRYHIIEKNLPFEIADTGIVITPLAVHHGDLGIRLSFQEVIPIDSHTPVSGMSTPPDSDGTVTSTYSPYIALGFKIANAVVYISDVSAIPEETWSLLERSSEEGKAAHGPVFVCDCVSLDGHKAHIGLAQAVAMARRLGATRTYLTGIDHNVSHEEYVQIGEALERDEPLAGVHTTSAKVDCGIKMIPEGAPIWVRPSFDGLRVFVASDGTVKDEAYD